MAALPTPLEELARRCHMDCLPTVADELLDASLVSHLSVEWARTHVMLPVRLAGESCVLMADPGTVSQQSYLELMLGEHLRPILAPRDVILNAIERCYFRKDDRPEAFLKDLKEAAGGAGRAPDKSDDLLQVAEKAPVTQLVNLILLEAMKRRASDIHFEPFQDCLRIRYRIDGNLYEQAGPPKHMEEALVSRLKVMAKMDIAEKRLPQDGMASVRVGERPIDVRVSTVPVAEGERVVLRLLDRASALLPLGILGMGPSMLEGFMSLLAAPNGVVVVSGPTGSGKTTTLYAALGTLDSTKRNILTIEDPIEYQLPNIGQIQVKPKIGLTFGTGLRHILRQDPDVILVGETRDLETAEIAIRASLTGHLVLTTLHTNDAPGVILRLIDMGVEPYLLSSCMRGSLAQRLVRKLCPLCSRDVLPTEKELASLGPARSRLVGRTVRAPHGCDACLEGYTGRLGLFELMVWSEEMQDVLRDGAQSARRLRDVAEKNGMTRLLDDGIDKILSGITSIREVVGAVSPALM
jgi:general secretion pathway protein E